VGLAQALLHDPDVLIMDEPTAGLDPNQIRQFRENVQRLRATKTLLVSTHILHEAEATADRVLLVDGGRLVFDGMLAELKENGSIEKPFYRLTNRGELTAPPAASVSPPPPPAPSTSAPPPPAPPPKSAPSTRPKSQSAPPRAASPLASAAKPSEPGAQAPSDQS
jgi:ABC-type glutathione transport system ATPase component